VQVVLASHATAGVDVTVVAEVDKVFVPVVNVVEVAVMFHPDPEPVASPMSRPWFDVTVWSNPFRVAENVTFPGADTKASDPPVSVAVAVEADAADAGSNTNVAIATPRIA
jgi:hypothetical protein